MTKLNQILTNLQSQGKIQILDMNNFHFKILKNNNEYKFTPSSDSCDHCNKGTRKKLNFCVEFKDYNYKAWIPYTLTSCLNCLVYSLKNYDDCGWED